MLAQSLGLGRVNVESSRLDLGHEVLAASQSEFDIIAFLACNERPHTYDN